MDFTLTDEQELLRETARALLTKEFPSTLLRAADYDPTPDGPAEARRAFDTHLRGWFALGDEPLVDLCLFAEESGAAVVHGPFWSSAALALPFLRAAGHAEADALAAGQLTATVALAGADGVWLPNGEPTKCFVPDADGVDRVVWVDADPDGGGAVSVLEPSSLVLREVAGLDRSRPVFEVARADPGAGPAPVAVGPAAVSDALDRATVALAAELVGVARWLRETTLGYVVQRLQFDRPVGSFQGLQWKLVDAALVHERAAAAVYFAAMCLDAGDPDRHAAVHVAKATAGEAARRWAEDGLQSHGGIGYTWEHDLHLRLRRAHSGDHLLGDRPWHLDRLAEITFGG